MNIKNYTENGYRAVSPCNMSSSEYEKNEFTKNYLSGPIADTELYNGARYVVLAKNNRNIYDRLEFVVLGEGIAEKWVNVTADSKKALLSDVVNAL